MIKKLILISLLLSGCGSPEVNNCILVYELDEIVECFKQQIFDYSSFEDEEGSPQFTYSKLIMDNPTNIGHCYSPPPSIAIQIDFWENANNWQRIALIYHELGHCEIFRGHIEQLLGDDCPASIMHPFILSPECFQDHYEHYILELSLEYI